MQNPCELPFRDAISEEDNPLRVEWFLLLSSTVVLVQTEDTLGHLLQILDHLSPRYLWAAFCDIFGVVRVNTPHKGGKRRPTLRSGSGVLDIRSKYF